MKAIETVYKGYRFRSRLEARWAVFFDALGVKWEYEKEGYDLGRDGWYLPDFWLTDWQMWVEVKGTDLTEDVVHKAFSLMQQGQHPVCVVFDFDNCILFRSDLEKNGWFVPRPIRLERPLPPEHMNILSELKAVAHEIDALDKSDPLRDEWLAIYRDLDQKRMNSIGVLVNQLPWTTVDNENKAISAARRARFEHGESGAGILTLLPPDRAGGPVHSSTEVRRPATGERLNITVRPRRNDAHSGSAYQCVVAIDSPSSRDAGRLCDSSHRTE